VLSERNKEQEGGSVFSLEDILDIAIQLEKNGEKVYRQAAERANQTSLRAFMVWMADQEAAHAKWFEQLKVGAGKIAGDPDLVKMGKHLLEDVLGEHSFSLEDLDLARLENLQELIEVTIEFEKDTALFYEMLAAFIQEKESRALLSRIIEEEHRHVRMLQEFIGN
jgi:rubrerythrin